MPHATRTNIDFFISRAGVDAAWAKWIAALLHEAGYSVYSQDHGFVPGPSFQEYMEKGAECKRTLAIVSPEYFDSPHCLLELRAAVSVQRLLLVRVRECKIPTLYGHLLHIDVAGRSREEAKTLILRNLTGARPLGSSDFIDLPDLAPCFIDTAALQPISHALFGRDRELEILDDAWRHDQTRVLSFIAFGGVGKSALVINWWHQNRAVGAQRILGWSFGSQGVKESSQASADEFIDYALRHWFNIEELPKDSWERGYLLAHELRRCRTLLILDGMEPIQFPPGPQYGRMRDPGMIVLLKTLAAQNPGLCVCTSRFPLRDLEGYEQAGMLTVDLNNLSPDDGGRYLRTLGVVGEDHELQRASIDFDNHALALTLLGNLLRRFGGDVRKRDVVPSLFSAKQGKHARRVLRAYENIFRDTPEFELLRLLSLFDRPADPAALAAVRRLPFSKWAEALESLADARLVDYRDPAGVIDTHAIIREHFAEEYASNDALAFRKDHETLYQHYRELAPYRPETLGAMTPLFYAVYHGCRANLHQEVAYEIYDMRMQRDLDFFLIHSLGAIGATLSSLANFFDVPWTKASSSLNSITQGWVLGNAGFALGLMGRLEEAIDTFTVGLEAARSANDMVSAARDLNNISILNLALGNISQAIEAGQQSIGVADRSGDALVPIVTRARTAFAFLQAGRASEAESLFEEAESLRCKATMAISGSATLNRFDLLLDQGKMEEVLETIPKTMTPEDSLLGIALSYLFRGQASTIGSPQAKQYLDDAVLGLRRANQVDELPRGLLARARHCRSCGDVPRAQADLNEVRLIAERCNMRLFACDVHLEYARISLAQRDSEGAYGHLQRAEELVRDTGYQRRNLELEAIRAELNLR